MSRSKVETAVVAIVTMLLVAAVVWMAGRMQLLRPVDYREDMRFKTAPTANPPALGVESDRFQVEELVELAFRVVSEGGALPEADALVESNGGIERGTGSRFKADAPPAA